MEFSVQNLCGFLIRSKLMAPEGMKAMHQRWQAEAKDQVGNAGRFVRWLIDNQYVTEYQASLLAKGHADDFFINEYMVLERLGRGRMAGVYKCAHPLGQVVAIKVVPPSKAKNPQVLGRFQREAKLSMKLKHPNVVRTFQLGQVGEVNYLVMEYLDGETLDDVLQRRTRLPPAEAVRLVHQALAGLQHLHEQGMVHRDLKPANLMLVPSPGDSTLRSTVKILDIGLARKVSSDEVVRDQRGDLTAEGVLLGTPDYLSPEQARDPRLVDIRTDIYSLGCVLYHALTGQPPFPDTNILSQMVRHATETPKPLQEFNPQIPDGLEQIVEWMMAKKRDERYPTPERAAQALHMYLLADDKPAEQPEETPELRSYLTWLEAKDSEAKTIPPVNSDSAARPGSNPGAATVKPRSNPMMPASAPALSAGKQTMRSERKDKKDRANNVPAPVPSGKPTLRPNDATTSAASATTPTPPEIDVIDVELRPAAAPWWPLAKRDWLMLGIGAGATLVLVVIVYVLSMMFGS